VLEDASNLVDEVGLLELPSLDIDVDRDRPYDA
jgi:hypothetical protein